MTVAFAVLNRLERLLYTQVLYDDPRLRRPGV
jgi:hypothetical protein